MDGRAFCLSYYCSYFVELPTISAPLEIRESIWDSADLRCNLPAPAGQPTLSGAKIAASMSGVPPSSPPCDLRQGTQFWK